MAKMGGSAGAAQYAQGMSIISWTITIVELLSLTTGFGYPYEGNSVESGSEEFQALATELQSALPGADWTGAASEAYAEVNRNLADIAAKLAQLDLELAALTKEHAELVAQMRLAFGALKATLLGALVTELAITMLVPAPVGPPVGDGVRDFSCGGCHCGLARFPVHRARLFGAARPRRERFGQQICGAGPYAAQSAFGPADADSTVQIVHRTALQSGRRARCFGRRRSSGDRSGCGPGGRATRGSAGCGCHGRHRDACHAEGARARRTGCGDGHHAHFGSAGFEVGVGRVGGQPADSPRGAVQPRQGTASRSACPAEQESTGRSGSGPGRSTCR